jgi:hypothetical protein
LLWPPLGPLVLPARFRGGFDMRQKSYRVKKFEELIEILGFA